MCKGFDLHIYQNNNKKITKKCFILRRNEYPPPHHFKFETLFLCFNTANDIYKQQEHATIYLKTISSTYKILILLYKTTNSIQKKRH